MNKPLKASHTASPKLLSSLSTYRTSPGVMCKSGVIFSLYWPQVPSVVIDTSMLELDGIKFVSRCTRTPGGQEMEEAWFADVYKGQAIKKSCSSSGTCFKLYQRNDFVDNNFKWFLHIALNSPYVSCAIGENISLLSSSLP